MTISLALTAVSWLKSTKITLKISFLRPKTLIVCFSGIFLEHDVGGRLVFPKFPTFSMCSNQLVINQLINNKQNGGKWRPT